jgi:superfamily I DNA/RNA helicase
MKTTVYYGPPGTGKTRTLMERLTAHIQGGGRRALFCSHTKAAARTAFERWGGASAGVDIQTLHSFCFKALKLTRSQTVDEAKLEILLHEFGLDIDDGGEGKAYVEVMSVARATGDGMLETYDRLGQPGTRSHFQAFVATYDRWKTQFGYRDFSDMLDDYSRSNDAGGYDLLVVDEAQDLTPLHWKALSRFMELNPDADVVIGGDDDQCIYSYAGADAHGMDTFINRYGGNIRTLSQSYRIPRVVHTLAKSIITRVEKRVKKVYKPTKEQGTFMLWPDPSYMKLDPARDTLVLFSDKFGRRDIEDQLRDSATPYEAVSGLPGPLQTRAGRAIRMAHTIKEWTDEDKALFKKGLSGRGVDLAGSVGVEAVAEKIRAGYFDYTTARIDDVDYLARVDHSQPCNIRIATIHGAKGMEADDVHLFDTRSQAAISESLVNPDHAHRLAYVAVTRPRHNLYIYEGVNGYGGWQ